MPDTPTLLTVEQFARRHQAFTTASLRWLIFRARPRYRTENGQPSQVEGNGFAPAIKRIGSRVYLDEDRFFEIVELQNGHDQSPDQASV